MIEGSAIRAVAEGRLKGVDDWESGRPGLTGHVRIAPRICGDAVAILKTSPQIARINQRRAAGIKLSDESGGVEPGYVRLKSVHLREIARVRKPRHVGIARRIEGDAA